MLDVNYCIVKFPEMLKFSYLTSTTIKNKQKKSKFINKPHFILISQTSFFFLFSKNLKKKNEPQKQAKI